MNSVISTAGLLTPTGKIRFFLTFSWYVDMVSSLLHHTTEKKVIFICFCFFQVKTVFHYHSAFFFCMPCTRRMSYRLTSERFPDAVWPSHRE